MPGPSRHWHLRESDLFGQVPLEEFGSGFISERYGAGLACSVSLGYNSGNPTRHDILTPDTVHVTSISMSSLLLKRGIISSSAIYARVIK